MQPHTPHHIYFDIEADSLDFYGRHHCLSYAVNESQPRTVYGYDESWRILSGWLADPNVNLIGHNIIAYDLAAMLYRHTNINRIACRVLDTLLLSKIRNPYRMLHGLADWGDTLWAKGIIKTGKVDVSMEQFKEGDPELMRRRCEHDVVITRQLFKYLVERGGPLGEWYLDIEGRWAGYMAIAQSEGIHIKCGKMGAALEDVTQKIRDIERKCKVKKPGSSQQWYEYLLNKFKAKRPTNKELEDYIAWFPRTKKGAPSFSVDTRRVIEEMWPEVSQHFEYKDLRKVRNFFDPQFEGKSNIYRRLIVPHGKKQTRLFAELKYYGTRTCRTNYSNPYVNSFPKGKVRQAVGPNPGLGLKVLGLDVKGLEWSLLGWRLREEVGDHTIWDQNIRGESPKTLTIEAFGRDCFRMFPDEESKRDIAKRVNYAMAYGQLELGTLTTLMLPPTDMDKIRRGRARRMPGLDEYTRILESRMRRGLMLNGYGVPVRAMGGKGEEKRSTALNTYMQSTGVFYARRIFTLVMDELVKVCPEARLMLFNHDEIQVLVNAVLCEETVQGVVERAEQAFKKRPIKGIPLITGLDWKMGESWDDTH